MDDSGAPGEDYCGQSVRTTIGMIGGKWTMLILFELLQSERRYADLQRRVGGRVPSP